VVHKIATTPLLIANRTWRKITTRIVMLKLPNSHSFRQLNRNSNPEWVKTHSRRGSAGVNSPPVEGLPRRFEHCAPLVELLLAHCRSVLLGAIPATN